ncbi:UBN2_2 domain-containing protein, partial [Cephalotus follicularis]
GSIGSWMLSTSIAYRTHLATT